MSIITKGPNDKILMLTKGADTTMMGILKSENIKDVQEELNEFAIEGLRTLVMGCKYLEQEEYEQ